jgi:hypothetical protein
MMNDSTPSDVRKKAYVSGADALRTLPFNLDRVLDKSSQRSSTEQSAHSVLLICESC